MILTERGRLLRRDSSTMLKTVRDILSESRLRIPVARPGVVTRTALVDRWLGAPAPSVVAVVAPAGYGKTTLLAQWACHNDQRVGWVSADTRDNDPAVLLAHIAAAVDRIEPINPPVFWAIASPAAATTVPPLPLLCQTFFFAPFFLRFTPVRRGTFFGSPVAAFFISPPSSSAISASVRLVRIEAGAISVTSS